MAEDGDSYMLQGDLWSAVLPPDVSPSYHAGFICLRCAIESIDRPLCREDITGCMTNPAQTISDGDFEVELRLPKRSDQAKDTRHSPVAMVRTSRRPRWQDHD